MHLISHSFHHVNALIPLYSHTNTRLPPWAKTLLSTPELKTPVPGHHPMWVMFFTWLWFLAPAPTPWDLFSFLLGSSILPTKQAAFLPCSGFDTLLSSYFPLGTPSYLGFDYRAPYVEGLFTLLRFQVSVPAVLHTYTPYTLLIPCIGLPSASLELYW